MKDSKHFEHKVGERTYHFFCEIISPIQEVKDALSIFLGQVTFIEKSIAEAQAKQAEEAKKAECSADCEKTPCEATCP